MRFSLLLSVTAAIVLSNTDAFTSVSNLRSSATFLRSSEYDFTVGVLGDLQ